ncbi:hypothetical protein CHH80_18125, partial [Bacillus sp. 7504-2]
LTTILFNKANLREENIYKPIKDLLNIFRHNCSKVSALLYADVVFRLILSIILFNKSDKEFYPLHDY